MVGKKQGKKKIEELYSCFPCSQENRSPQYSDKNYGNIMKHVEKSHNKLFIKERKKDYDEKPVNSKVIYCEFDNCIRKNLAATYRCFKNSPIYSKEWYLKYHKNRPGPFRCGFDNCFHKGLHKFQWGANKCREYKIKRGQAEMDSEDQDEEEVEEEEELAENMDIDQDVGKKKDFETDPDLINDSINLLEKMKNLRKMNAETNDITEKSFKMLRTLNTEECKKHFVSMESFSTFLQVSFFH